MNKKTAIVAGATGLVGSNLLNELAKNNQYSKIIVLSRREPVSSNNKIQYIKHNFEESDKLIFDEKIDTCFCALGTTQKKMGKKGLHKVDYDYVLKLAQMCAINSIESFLVVSSQGANARSTFFYMQTKGKMEEAIKQVKIPSTYIVRPSLITGKREEKRWLEDAGYVFYKLFTPLMIGKLRKVRPVSALQIAKAMIHLDAENSAGVHTIESDYMQSF